MTTPQPPYEATPVEAALRESLDALAEEVGLGEQLRAVSGLRWRGEQPDPRPQLQLEDVSAIPFLDGIPGVEEYQHRARVRCGSGDVFVAVTPETPGYEDYCRHRLGLGEPEFLWAEPAGNLLQVARAAGVGATYARILDLAREHHGILIHPYMANSDVWELAQRLADDSEQPITVLGPPPASLWLANDKQLFHHVVAATLSESWLVDTRFASTPDGLADALWALAQTHTRVGLKRTRCASAMGNEVFDGSELLRQGRQGTSTLVAEFLSETLWPEGEPVLAVAWEDCDISPSTQLWIPPRGHGEPRLDGVYEQILAGDARVFVGSRPSTLPSSLNRRLGEAAVRVAASLQYLGYVGRCSFDHLVCGDAEGPDPHILFTECNGRWGGTSSPMSLVDRLRGTDAHTRGAYRAQDVQAPGLVGARFDDVLAAVGEDAFDPTTGRGRYVFYNVGPLARSGKLDVIAFGNTPAHAEASLLEELPRRLGV